MDLVDQQQSTVGGQAELVFGVGQHETGVGRNLNPSPDTLGDVDYLPLGVSP